jgi:hypothetical protein
MSRSSSKRSQKKPFARNRSQLQVERLEDRAMPSTTPTISGFVYGDTNNNGSFDAGEPPVAGSQIVLINNSNGKIAAATTTAADGSYSFTTDGTVPGPEQQTAAQSITIGPALTNFALPAQLPQFNPSLGTLDKVVITENGTITSNIQAENTSPVADTIDGTVSGSFSLSAPGVTNDLLTITGQTNSAPVAGNPSDDTSLSGPASVTWDGLAASGTSDIPAITDPDSLLAYEGTGTVAITETAKATSVATDQTANIIDNIQSHGVATITVTYYYHSPGSLQYDTSYTVEQPNVPAGYTIPGLNGKNGSVLPYNPTPPEEITNIIVTPQNPVAPNNNFGELNNASISGIAYVQSQANETYLQGTTPPLGGVTITLTGGNLTTPLTTTTAADGTFSFKGLMPGNYTVTQTQPTSYLPGTITAGTDSGQVGAEQVSQIQIASGDAATGYDFGELNLPSIAGVVYVEPNAPTQTLFQNQTATPGISGVTVTLTGSDGSTQTTTTGAQGTYSFNNLNPALTYKVAITHPSGYLVGTDTAGNDGGTVSSTSEEIDAISVPGPSGATGYNFGELQAASLAGLVYVDTQKSGQYVSGDPLLSGVTITLTGTSDHGSVSQNTTTNSSGAYSFTNLRPGSYTITETPPSGYLNGAVTVGSQNSGTTGTLNIDSINLDPNVNGANNNFGELVQPSLTGFVYLEPNAPTQTLYQSQTATPGIGGVTVTLTGSDGSSQTTTTNAQGAYTFNNLKSTVTYEVTITHPNGYLVGTDTPGNDGGTVSATSEEIDGVSLANSSMATGYNFGELQAASLAGNVYVDAQNDGQLDPGDPPIAGATLTLTGFNDQGPVSLTTTTASNGTYSFANLRPGTYAISTTQPTGYLAGATTVGSQGGTGSTDNITDISLDPGVNGVSNNFGDVTPNTQGNPPPNTANLQGMVPVISKTQLTGDPYLANTPFVGDMKLAVAAEVALTGQQPSVLAVMNDVNTIQAGGQSALVSQLWTSSAHRALQADQVYQAVLGRAPTAQETSQAVALLSSGTSQLQLMENLYVSPAYQQLHAGSQTSLATALSQDILNVTPGTVSTQQIVSSLGAQPLSTVVHNLLMSTAGLSNLIDETYLATVYRPATAAEIQTWIAPLQAGTMTLDQLAQQLLSSQEFYTLASNVIQA